MLLLNHLNMFFFIFFIFLNRLKGIEKSRILKTERSSSTCQISDINLLISLIFIFSYYPSVFC